MTQRDRDRLVVLKKAQKKLILQGQAAAELGITIRQVKRLLRRLKEEGDKAVVHGLRGRTSNRKLTEATREKIADLVTGSLPRVRSDPGQRVLGKEARCENRPGSFYEK